MSIAFDQLPDDAAALKRIIAALAQDAVNAQAEIAKLRFQLARYRRAEFGRSSEKLEREADQLELAIETLEADQAERLAGECQEFRARPGGSIDYAMARVKRSPKRTANWALAMHHSRGGMIHSFSDRFKTRKRSLVAASSLGKWPLARTARRSLALSASMAFVVYKIRRTSPGKA